MAADTTASDDDVTTAARSLETSYNADAAFATLFAAACGVAHHRPQLLEPLLVRAVDAAVCMTIDSVPRFWQYANYVIERDDAPSRMAREFVPAALLFYRQSLRQYEPTIERLLQARLAEVD